MPELVGQSIASPFVSSNSESDAARIGSSSDSVSRARACCRNALVPLEEAIVLGSNSFALDFYPALTSRVKG
jgi:hypothetical protein